MFILSLAERFATPEFNIEFNVTKFSYVQVLTLIRASSISEAQRIVSIDADNATGRFEPIGGSTMDSKTEKVLCELWKNKFHRPSAQR